MSRRQLARNASFSVVQVFVSALSLLVIYRLLMQRLSIAEIGLWSLVIGSTAVARLSELGLGAGVMRFVAADLAAGAGQRAARTIGAAALMVTVLVGLMALLVQPLLLTYLIKLTPLDLHQAVRMLLPAALLGVVLAAAGNVFAVSIDGAQRMDIRAVLQMLSTLVQLAATWYVLPRWGLLGLGWVQVAQAGFLLVSSALTVLILLRRPLRDYAGFDRPRLKELFSYGGGMQLSAIAQLLTEPLLKVLLTAFSGLALTGYYDIANRIVLQFRSVIIAAYNALVPHVAAFSGKGEPHGERLRAIYREASGVLLVVILPYFACVAAGLPLALTLWKGQFDFRLLLVALLQLTAWLVNLLTTPAYMLYLGIGRLRWTVLTHVLVALLTAVLGSSFGWVWGGTGVLAGGAIALAAGSLLVMAAFHRQYSVAWRDQFPLSSMPGMLLMAAAIAASTVIALAQTWPGWPIAIALPLCVGAAAIGLMMLSPLRAKLLAQINLPGWLGRSRS